MRAIVCTKYGPPEVLQLKEVEKPTPRDNEVLIKVHATTAHVGDTRIRGLRVPGGPFVRLFLGLTKPKWSILGMELAVVTFGTDAKKDSKDAKVSEPIKKPVIEKIDWSKVNKDIEKMMIEARKETQELASAKLDTWIEQNMKRVGNDFLEWYFSYWTQQKLGLQSLLAQVWHWVDVLIFLPGTFFTP